ncbi:hypothetical protein [Sorangium sp. So ce1000]|uniref:hypothetical protein n=1 Tax=Sorangium sp. So ce1000 TaxID=3133325 RepID=UPI003F62496F
MLEDAVRRNAHPATARALRSRAWHRPKNAAFDFTIEGESYRPRLKPKLDESNTAAPVPARSKPPTHPRGRRRWPLLLTDWWRRQWRFLALAAAFTGPLYVVAIDWGRWIHVYLSMASILLLASKATIRPVHPALVALYVSVWSLPHCGAHLSGGFAESVVRFGFRVARHAGRLLPTG